MRIILVKRFLLLLALLLLPATMLTGCSAGGSNPEVVASFYPLQFVAEQVLGPDGTVRNLTGPGVEPHDLELTPRQVAQLSGAKVVIYEKGVAPAVDQAVANDGPARTVDAASVVHLRKALGGQESAAGRDPHFWQDPTLLAKVADAFTTEISKADPAHASDFRARNATLQGKLRALDAAYRTGLTTCRTRALVVSHDAFEYLGSRYHLQVHPIAGLSPDAEPSVRHLAQLGDLIRTDHITTVFSERLASPQLADALARDLGITTAVLDPVEGLTTSDSKETYLSLMRENLRAIQKAGGCS